ncbi:hypothetical protein ACR6C2_40990 [Streptomyces sp. INA 01156]
MTDTATVTDTVTVTDPATRRARLDYVPSRPPSRGTEGSSPCPCAPCTS